MELTVSFQDWIQKEITSKRHLANLDRLWSISLASWVYQSPTPYWSGLVTFPVVRLKTNLSLIWCMLVSRGQSSPILRSPSIFEGLRSVLVLFTGSARRLDQFGAGDWWGQLANEMYQGQARFTTVACSQNKLGIYHIYFTVSGFNVIFSDLDLETVQWCSPALINGSVDLPQTVLDVLWTWDTINVFISIVIDV